MKNINWNHRSILQIVKYYMGKYKFNYWNDFRQWFSNRVDFWSNPPPSFLVQHYNGLGTILPTIFDQNEYDTLRRLSLTISTASEHARANRIASQMDYDQIPSAIDPLVKVKLLRKQRKETSIIIHYSYEKRFAHYKSKIHHIWDTSFPPITGIDSKIVVVIRNNSNLTKELVRRSPPDTTAH